MLTDLNVAFAVHPTASNGWGGIIVIILHFMLQISLFEQIPLWNSVFLDEFDVTSNFWNKSSKKTGGLPYTAWCPYELAGICIY